MNIQSTGMNMNNMMEMIKAQMMTMTMVSSMNGNNKNSDNKNNDNNFINVIYIFIITGVIDFICKTIFPEVSKIILEYYQSNLKSSKIINNIITISDIKTKTKSASITILVKISDHNKAIQKIKDTIEKSKPINETIDNIIKTSEHIPETPDNVIETPDNVIETPDNVIEISEPINETSNNVIETSEPIIGTPVTSLSKTNKNKTINNIIDVPIDNLKEKINPQNLYYNSEEKYDNVIETSEHIIETSYYTGPYDGCASCVGIESLDNDMTNYYSLDDNINDTKNYYTLGVTS